MGFGFTANCQTWYGLKAFKINSVIHYNNDSSQSPNYLWVSYHLIVDSIYQPQFIMNDSLNNRILPTKELLNSNWRSSGTVKEYKLNSDQMGWSDIQLRDSLVYPNLENIFGTGNVIKLY